MTLVAREEPNATRVPAVGDAGAVSPTARRIRISARSASVGLVHARVIDELVTIPVVSEVTGPGAVVSGGTAVVLVMLTGLEVLPTLSRVNTEYE